MRILDFADGFSSASAPSVTGVTSFQTYATESVAGSGTISNDNQPLQYRRVQGSGGAQTTSTTPFGSAASINDGTVVILVGQSDTNTLTVPYSDTQYGAVLNGDAILGQYDTLQLIYDSTSERWVELCRNF